MNDTVVGGLSARTGQGLFIEMLCDALARRGRQVTVAPARPAVRSPGLPPLSPGPVSGPGSAGGSGARLGGPSLPLDVGVLVPGHPPAASAAR